mmetsp:Transcript_7300/g.20598  ORF Transcript_7300/g.20598 Transcript_7300/m.20598 type:complete len:191 (-) Transcript_7300:422-994(-)
MKTWSPIFRSPPLMFTGFGKGRKAQQQQQNPLTSGSAMQAHQDSVKQRKEFSHRVHQTLGTVQVADNQAALGHASQAVDSYTQALVLHTATLAEIFVKRSQAHAAEAASSSSPEGSWASSLADARQAMALDPRSALACLCAGAALLELQEPEQAAVVLEAGVLLAPTDQRLHDVVSRAESMLAARREATQ